MPVPMILRSARPKPTLVHETHEPKKYKKKRPMPVHESPRNHFATQAQKKEKQPKKVVDLEVEVGMEDIDAEGAKPISKL